MTKGNKIKPCPFCGGDAELSSFQAPRIMEAYVRCTHCASTGSVYSSLITRDEQFVDTLKDLEKQAIDFWNKAKR
jgi:Lar family restriction alleviation protein